MLTPRPQSFKIIDEMGVLTIKRRWFNIKHPIMLFFSLFWNGFLVFWYSMLPNLIDEGGKIDYFVSVFYLFPLIHVSVGIGLLYYALCGFFNHTSVVVERDKVLVRTGPLPWPGNRTLTSREVKQFYTQEVVSYTKNGYPTVSYKVNAILRNNSKVVFVQGLAAKDEGLFLERTLEERLFIRNESVEGEVVKGST
ncbi:MAG TPA: hypothetical protein VJ861_12405 [Treponemataceae bacterium]|nr:hypothetical protein [Treponemataceae bacterium]